MNCILLVVQTETSESGKFFGYNHLYMYLIAYLYLHLLTYRPFVDGDRTIRCAEQDAVHGRQADAYRDITL